MKQRILPMLLALMMLLTMTPSALAAESEDNPSAPASIELQYTPDAVDYDGTSIFFVPSVTDLDTPAYKETTFTAVVKDDSGAELTGKTVTWTWTWIPAFGEMTLEPNADGTAVLVISNSAMESCDHNQHVPIMVTASCEGVAVRKRILICVPDRTAQFVRIYKENTAIASDTLVQGSSAVYTAIVYDQYGMPMDGEELYAPNGDLVNRPAASADWSVSGGDGVTINNGTVNVAPDAAAGNRTVTVVSGSASASVDITVTEAAPTHNFSPDWTSDETSHWHACTDPGCSEVSDRGEHIWDDGVVTREAAYMEPGVKTYTCTVCGRTRTETIPALDSAHTQHSWAEAWSSDAGYHWHECTADGCGITEPSEKDGYGAHVYDDDADTTCNVCGYIRTVTAGFTVTFDANGGTAGTSALTTGADGRLSSLPVPSRSGYTFNGWFTAASGGERVTTDTVFTENTTVYAQWTRQTSNGGDGGDGGSGYVPPASGTSGSSEPPISTAGQDPSIPADTITAVPAADIRGGTAVAVVNEDMGNEIVNQAEASNSANVVIAPEVAGNVTKAEVSIPADIVGQLKSRTSASLTVSTPVASVTIPNSALGSLSGADGAVTITAGQEGRTIELTITADGETLTGIPGGLTLTVPGSFDVPGTVAVLVHPDGTQEVIRKSVADGGSMTIPLDGSAQLEIVDNSKYFADVPAASWEADAVAFVSAHEIFGGTGPDQFSPNQFMSRGMLAVALYNLENSPAQAPADMFSDIGGSEWYAGGVAWAAAQGIVDGYGNGQFGPDDSITREQLAVMLWRYMGRPAAAGGELDFADAAQASDWALEALLWAAESGIINGKGGGILDPGGYATRAETAQILKNLMELQARQLAV